MESHNTALFLQTRFANKIGIKISKFTYKQGLAIMIRIIILVKQVAIKLANLTITPLTS